MVTITPKYEAMGLDDLDALPDPEWLIEGVLMRQAVTLVAGPRGTYKTFFAMDMAMTLARDDVFRFPASFPKPYGHFIDRSTFPNKKAKVLYIVGESRGAAKFRFRAYKQFHALKDNPEGVRVHPDRVDLFNHKEDVLALVEAEDPDVVIIDTWSRNTYGLGDGLDKKDLDTVLSVVHKIKMGGARNGRAVVLLHHPNQARTNSLRGHSALGDDTDIILSLEPVANLRHGEHKMNVHNERTKEMDEFRSYEAELVPVFLVDNHGKPMEWPWGEPISSLVIAKVAPYKRKSGGTSAGLSGAEKAAIWIKESAEARGGTLVMTQAEMAESAGVSKRDVKEALGKFEYDPSTSTVTVEVTPPASKDLEEVEFDD